MAGPTAAQPKARAALPPPVHWPHGKPVAQAKALHAGPAAAVIQRQVFRLRSGPNHGKWYTDKDENELFDTKEEAEKYQKKLIAASNLEKKQRLERNKLERHSQHKKKIESEYRDYKAPPSDKIRLFKNKDREYDEVPLTRLTPGDAKSFVNRQIALRWSGLFSTQVIELGGHHFVMDPGSDIGITPGLQRPDMIGKGGFPPMSRIGKPKTYASLANDIDNMVEKYTESSKFNTQQVRERIGRDLHRLTRNSPVKGTLAYTKEEMEALAELASILRLDKARVPKATRYIRRAFVSGEHSFTELLVKKVYVGAGKGGVEALRGEIEDDGELSEGSDIEETKVVPKRSRSRSPSPEERKKSRSRSRSRSPQRIVRPQRGGGVREFDTWGEASMHDLPMGTRIRILNHDVDISGRVFELIRDYDPSLPYASVADGKHLRWIN